jgi:hypothetical protein
MLKYCDPAGSRGKDPPNDRFNASRRIANNNKKREWGLHEPKSQSFKIPC